MDRTCIDTRPRGHLQRPDRLGEERATIRAGIELVASGAARRVILCGLRFSERLLATAVMEGDQAGLQVRLDRSPEGAAAIVVSAWDPARAN